MAEIHAPLFRVLQFGHAVNETKRKTLFVGAPPVTSVARFRKGNTVCRRLLQDTILRREREEGFQFRSELKCGPTCGTPTLGLHPHDNGASKRQRGAASLIGREGVLIPRLRKFSSALSRSKWPIEIKMSLRFGFILKNHEPSLCQEMKSQNWKPL
ncbi:hypothetical protein CEXT_335581 [Caerostris extrusa]|uniref:Uncharacterized protein n=1 Tax=Caerostris extrusa TaxID=172846 RepID=A0AAV4W3C0_CAEEX|nr:hypothetical protein CEXT_335581 [Caerostris extrusa]